MKKNIVFIIGVGRSGTSLLQSMLGAHPEICFLPETQLLRKYCFSSKKKQTIESNPKESFIQELKADKAFGRLQISPEECMPDGAVSIVEVYNTILKVYLDRHNKSIPGDKDPRNLDFIKEIHTYFPDAHILHIIRDPRDVVLSRTKADWSKHWPFFMHACMYNTQMKRGRKRAANLFKEQYAEVYYESLLEHPEKELKQICEWLGVSYDSSMLHYQETAKSLVDESEMQWKKETLGPLLSKNKAKWKKAFSPYQNKLIEKICKPIWKSLPYEKSPKASLSVGEHIKISCFAFFAKVFDFLYPLRLKFL